MNLSCVSPGRRQRCSTSIATAGVDLGEAAALPVAAGTALRALDQAGALLGRRVLVTGAFGGVGGFAVQLARLGGAQVIAVAGSEDGRRWVAEPGADEVVGRVGEVAGPRGRIDRNVPPTVSRQTSGCRL